MNNDLKNMSTDNLKVIGFDIIQQITFHQQQLVNFNNQLNLIYSELNTRNNTPPDRSSQG